jgi:thioredoxin
MSNVNAGTEGVVLELGAEAFAREVEAHRGLVLVDFSAEWCGPCRMIAPTLRRLAGEYAGRVKVVKVDVDAAPAVAAKYGVRNLPTVVLFRGGVELERIVGALPHAAYVARLAPHLPALPDDRDGD